MGKIGKKAQCKKCGDIIQSMYRHDFVRCGCGAIAVDGGRDYCRCIGSPDDFEWSEFKQEIRKAVIDDNQSKL
jgi:hypothetical protein